MRGPSITAPVEALLEMIDEEEIAAGRPPLSAITQTDDGDISPVFLRTAEKHKLRRPGETDAELVARIAAEVYRAHRKPAPSPDCGIYDETGESPNDQ